MKEERYKRKKKLESMSEDLNNIKTDPVLSLLLLEDYINKYPDDYNYQINYAALLVTLGRYEEAEKRLDYVENNYIYDYRFDKNCSIIAKEKVLDKYKYKLLFTKLRLYSSEKRYLEALSILEDNYDFLRRNGLSTKYVKIALCKWAGLEDSLDINNFTYKIIQFFNYNKDLFIDHVKEKHIYTDDLDSFELEKGTYFNKNFPLEEVVEKISNIVPECDNKLHAGFVENQYYFKYDDCGICNGEKSDYFVAVAPADTNEFITMYPIPDIKNIKYCDLNNNVKVLTRRKSQIDKFNSKYNM